MIISQTNSDYILVKRKNIYILLLPIPMLSASCKVDKSYVRPETVLLDSLAQQRDSASIADEQWQVVYTDNTLRSLIDCALEYNKDMPIAATYVKGMIVRKHISVANLLPQLNGRAEAKREVENHDGHSCDVGNTYEAKALLSWKLDPWGDLRWRRAAAIAEYLQSVETQYTLHTTIVSEVTQAYCESAALDTELEVVRQIQKAREEGVRLARICSEGGFTPEASYQQAQVELAHTATLIPDLEHKISIKKNDTAFLAGEFPTRVERSHFLQELDVPKSLPVGLPSGLLERRSDIRAAEQQLIAEHACIRVTYTNMFSRLSLAGQPGLKNDVLSNSLQSPYFLSNGTVLTPFFNQGKSWAALKAQKASSEAEVRSYEKVVSSASKEARNAIVDFNRIEEVYQLRLKLERSAKMYVELAQLQYISGVINYMDVLDAQRGYFDAQTGVSNTICDGLIAVVNIYKALGGGWQVEK